MDTINQPVPAPAMAPQAAAQKPSKKPKKGLSSKLLIIVGVILLLGVAGYSIYYFYNKNQDLKAENQRLSNPEEVAKQQNEELIAEVGAIVDLPQGETPTIATVSDVSKLEGQAFFADAENGDKVLIYTEAKKAYLYRPSTNKVVNIAPVNIGDSQQ